MIRFLQSPTFLCLFAGGLAATLLLTPLVMRFACAVGAVDRGGHRKVHQGRPMPLMGGLAVALPFVGACLIGTRGITGMTRAIADQQSALSALALGSAGIVLLGAIDDRFGLGAKAKFLGQIAIAGFMCMTGQVIHRIGLPGGLGLVTVDPIVGVMITIVWIVGLTNAYNLVDGIDGLAAGLALIGSLGLAAIAMMNGIVFPALLCATLAGCLIGFLWYNFHPARIFLGDTGSMFLGFALANITLMSSMKTTGAAIVWAPVMVLALPILDTLTSMVRRYLHGRPIFTGDQGHMHHRLLRKGYGHRGTMLALCGFAGVLTVTAVTGRALGPGHAGYWLAVVGYGSGLLGLLWMTGYLDPSSWRRLCEGRRHNTLLSAFARYTALKLSGEDREEAGASSYVLWLICQEMCLDRIEVFDDEDGRRLFAASGRQGETPGAQEHVQDMCWFRALNHGGRMLRVGYRSNGLPEGLEITDVESCLARIMEQTDLRAIASIQHAPAAATEIFTATGKDVA
ncbi:MAG: undecaprenyl/decaprenyl-phosphate alpha-N-acetylglucosaminyl 1-phosphate transferase [bacterium]|nr:undecaprenyl/decaprenyl-phosphate alpha-N-acetylglucosaminyl 1-phosphate transferase [bacterium]